MVAGPKIREFIYNALLEYFLTQLKLAIVRRRIHFVPDRGDADLQVRGARPLQDERGAFLPYLWRRRFFFVLGSLLFIRRAADAGTISLGMQQSAARKTRRSSCCRRSANSCR